LTSPNRAFFQRSRVACGPRPAKNTPFFIFLFICLYALSHLLYLPAPPCPHPPHSMCTDYLAKAFNHFPDPPDELLQHTWSCPTTYQVSHCATSCIKQRAMYSVLSVKATGAVRGAHIRRASWTNTRRRAGICEERWRNTGGRVGKLPVQHCPTLSWARTVYSNRQRTRKKNVKEGNRESNDRETDDRRSTEHSGHQKAIKTSTVGSYTHKKGSLKGTSTSY